MKIQRFRGLTTTLTILTLTGFALGYGTAAGASTAENAGVNQVLLSSGFKAQTAKTSAQRAQLRALPDNQFTEVKQNGNTYYLFPDKKDNRLYAGDHYAYRAFQNFYKNKRLREKGVAVWEVNPANKSANKTIQVWEQWSPFDQWR